jgi:MprA protease rhombosortase-interaction domain-containing protein
VLRGQWLLAGLCSAAAGLVRPTGSALALAVGLAAVVAVAHRRDGVRPWLGGLLAMSGLLGYLGYVGWRTGTPTGWFDIQHTGWGSQFDAGASLVRFVRQAVLTGHEAYDLAVLLAMTGSLVLLVVAVRMRLPWPLLVYTTAVLIIVGRTTGRSTHGCGCSRRRSRCCSRLPSGSRTAGPVRPSRWWSRRRWPRPGSAATR